MPEKSWDKNAQVEFVNPYNFVPLSMHEVERGMFAREGGELSGVIECTLKTRSPLCIPDLESLPKEQLKGDVHKGKGLGRGVPFFRAPTKNDGKRGVPTIPGSEIRGVIRAAYETLDNGCLSVNNSNIASARSPFPLLPAILEVDHGAISLYEADMNDRPISPTDLERVWYSLRHPKRAGGIASHLTTHYLTKGSLITNVTEQMLYEALGDYNIVVGMYEENDKDFKDNKDALTLIPASLPNTGSWPVFYSFVAGDPATGQEDVVFLSPAQITRTVFHNRVDDLLGSHARCKDAKDLCGACRLFGMVGSSGQASSHVRFGDATMVLADGAKPEEHLIPGVTLKELSSPKTSSVEFYTKRPIDSGGTPALTWTYDSATYGYVEVGSHGFIREYEPKSVRFPPADRLPESLVRGRKFYLHHYVEGTPSEVDKAIIAAAQPETNDPAKRMTKRNMTAEVVGTDTRFTFKVFFDHITEEELSKLVWTLCIGENDLNGNQLHMLGHAKPLGFGSAKVCVTRVLVRDLAAGYSLNPRDVGTLIDQASFVDSSVVDCYRTITNYTLTKGLTVAYPLADNGGQGDNARASHNWFVANRIVGKGAENTFTPSVYRALPMLPTNARGGARLLLPKFVKDADIRQRDIRYDIDVSNEATIRV